MNIKKVNKIVILILTVVIGTLMVGCQADKKHESNNNESNNNEAITLIDIENEFDDKQSIAFSDKAIRKEVEAVIGIKDRDIVYEDVKYITSLSLDKDYEDGKVSNIESLKYLTGLKSLVIKTDKELDLSPISQLTNIEELDIAMVGSTDLSALSKLHKLKKLILRSMKASETTMVELTGLAGLESLETVYIGAGSVCTKGIETAKGVKSLTLNAYGTLDLYGIGKSVSIEELAIYGAGSENYLTVSDKEEIVQMSKLKRLTLYGNIYEIDELMNLVAQTLSLDNIFINGGNLSNVDWVRDVESVGELYIGDCCEISDYTPLIGTEDKIQELIIQTYDTELLSRTQIRGVKEFDDVLTLSQVENIDIIELYRDLEKINIDVDRDFDVSILSKLPNLKDISISIHGEAKLSGLESLTNVERFSLYASGQENGEPQIIDVSAINSMSNLKRLIIHCTWTSGLDQLINNAHLAELEELNIGCIDIGYYDERAENADYHPEICAYSYDDLVSQYDCAIKMTQLFIEYFSEK